MDKLKPEDYIYDRYGERIRIFVSDGKVEKELGKEVFVSLRKNKIIAIKLLINYLLNKGIINLLNAKNFVRNIKTSFIETKITNPKIIKIQYKNNIIRLIYSPIVISLIKEIFIEDQYNAKSSIHNKIVFDIGTNIGLFSIYAVLNGAKKVYAFEPVPETYQTLVNNVKINNLENKIIPINKALGEINKEEHISYSFGGDGTATLLKNNKGKKNCKSKNYSIG